MSNHEIVVFGGGCSERVFKTHAQIFDTADLAELDTVLRRKEVKACVVDCDLDYESVLILISKLRPELSVCLCERFDFQRLVVATESARLYRTRLIAGLWRQWPLGVLADIDELIMAETDCDSELVNTTAPSGKVPLPLRAGRHPLGVPQLRVHH